MKREREREPAGTEVAPTIRDQDLPWYRGDNTRHAASWPLKPRRPRVRAQLATARLRLRADCRQEDVCALVISSCDTAEVFEPAEHALDDVSTSYAALS